MPLENPSVIDRITPATDGAVALVIEDTGETTDGAERDEHFIIKLQTYVGYAVSDEFTREYPDTPLGKVAIHVLCQTPPTERMLRVTRVSTGNELEDTIPVSFIFGAQEPAAPVAPVAAPPPRPAAPARPRSLRPLVRALGLIFVLASLVAVLRSVNFTARWDLPMLGAGGLVFLTGLALLLLFRRR